MSFCPRIKWQITLTLPGYSSHARDKGIERRTELSREVGHKFPISNVFSLTTSLETIYSRPSIVQDRTSVGETNIRCVEIISVFLFPFQLISFLGFPRNDFISHFLLLFLNERKLHKTPKFNLPRFLLPRICKSGGF